MSKHSKRQVKIKNKAQFKALIFDEISIAVPVDYSNYSNVFSAENAAELLEHIGMNNNTIKPEKDKQPLFGPIYSLGTVELEILKTYIKTNLANDFIQTSNSLANTSILFNRKPDRSFHLCINYRGFNNITIKNRYPLSLIDKLLDQLGQAKQFT